MQVWLVLLAGVTIAAAALLANLPTLRFDLLNWDDPGYVLDNPWIRSWSRENLVHIFTRPYVMNFLPLHLLSYSLDYSLWGLKPFGYHLQQVLLNTLNAVLAFVVVRRIFGSFAVAFVTGLLFAVHPSHVEAVAWVSSRKEILSTAFLFLSLYFYLGAHKGRALRWGPLAASIVSFALGLLSKVSVVVLPLFLLLIDFMPVGSKRKGKGFWVDALGSKVPYGLIGLGAVLINSAAQVTARAAYAREPLQYLAVKGHAVWNYLVALAALRAGNPIYDTPQLTRSFFTMAFNLGGLVALPALFWFAYRRGHRVLALGVGWIFVMLLPALLFPLVTYMAERYLYAPSLGFCWVLAAGIVALGRRAGPGAAGVTATAALTLIPFLGFAYRTKQYNPVWANSESLWTYAIKRSRDYRVYNNLAQVRIGQKRWNDAEQLLKLGTQVDNVIVYRCLAVLYYDTQRYAQALQTVDKAFAIMAKQGDDPGERAELEYIRGASYWVLSQRDRAIEAWEAALHANPRHAQARAWLATARGEPTKRP
ncbi:MAG TPA: hypothetical protein VF363_10395 [Candidatus Eisenbacteria bacterium]